jgi:hypothetical protein
LDTGEIWDEQRKQADRWVLYQATVEIRELQWTNTGWRNRLIPRPHRPLRPREPHELCWTGRPDGRRFVNVMAGGHFVEAYVDDIKFSSR